MSWFIAGVFVTAVILWMWLAGRRARQAEAERLTQTPSPTIPPPQAKPAADDVASLAQAATDTIDPHGDAPIHARSLLEHPAFQRLVDKLADTATPFETVRQYAFGYAWVASSAGFEALGRRADRNEALAAVRMQVKRVSPGAMHYVLRYFSALDPRPAVGMPFCYAEPWWAGHGNLTESFRDYLKAREALGDRATFGGAFDTIENVQPDAVRELLSRLDHPFSAQLTAELDAWTANRIDTAYLGTFGRFWAKPDYDAGFEAEPWTPLLDEAEEAITENPPRSVVVVGAPRVGKSTFLRLVGRRIAEHDWRVFEATGAELMSGQTYFGELEGRLKRLSAELSTHKRVAWSVGDVLSLVTSGTHRGQSASILDQVMPALSSGRLLLLGEASPEGLSRLFQMRPSLRTQIQVFRLEPFEPDVLSEFTAQAAERLSADRGITIPKSTVEAVAQAATQYLGAADAPGVTVDVLKRAIADADSDGLRQVGEPQILSAVSQLTGLPLSILDEGLKVDMAEVQTFFGDRVMGQDEAVRTIVDRIAMLKAGLTDPDRPVGVFLFAGPTGTGKTELAKTVAEFLFGSPDRMVRLDMSEFQTGDSISKILGDRYNPGGDSLIEQVRQYPFTVVLLDEFEKAHDAVFDLFLQVFDDGRLSDASGRAADFRHTIIILTSNLGAGRRGAAIGFSAGRDAFDDAPIAKAITERFRPEFINRLDRIVIFRPLSRALMYRILHKELQGVLERRGLRNRDWAVEWESSALDFLIDKGFSAEMGARPLKRAIDQYLLAPLAHTLVEHRFPEGEQFLFVRSGGEALEVEFVDPDGVGEETSAPVPEAAAPAAANAPATATLPSLILQPSGAEADRAVLAAAFEALKARLDEEPWTSLQSDLAGEISHPDIWSRPERTLLFSRLELMDRVTEAMRTAEGLTRRLTAARGEGAALTQLVQRLALQLHLIEEGVEDVFAAVPTETLLSIEPVLDAAASPADAEAWRTRLTAMYQGWCERRRMTLETVAADDGPILRVTGFGAWRRLHGEAGLHVFEDPEGEAGVRRIALRVKVVPGPAAEPPPSRLAAALTALLGGATQPASIVRRYCEAPSPLVRDGRTGARSGRLADILAGDFDLILAA